MQQIKMLDQKLGDHLYTLVSFVCNLHLEKLLNQSNSDDLTYKILGPMTPMGMKFGNVLATSLPLHLSTALSIDCVVQGEMVKPYPYFLACFFLPLCWQQAPTGKQQLAGLELKLTARKGQRSNQMAASEVGFGRCRWLTWDLPDPHGIEIWQNHSHFTGQSATIT